jgi:hypothetical protein
MLLSQFFDLEDANESTIDTLKINTESAKGSICNIFSFVDLSLIVIIG